MPMKLLKLALLFLGVSVWSFSPQDIPLKIDCQNLKVGKHFEKMQFLNEVEVERGKRKLIFRPIQGALVYAECHDNVLSKITYSEIHKEREQALKSFENIYSSLIKDHGAHCDDWKTLSSQDKLGIIANGLHQDMYENYWNLENSIVSLILNSSSDMSTLLFKNALYNEYNERVYPCLPYRIKVE